MVSRTLLIAAANVARLTTMTPSSTTAAERMYLVRDGAVRSTIVLQGAEDEDAQRAIGELQHHVARATGVRLPVVKADAAGTLPADHVRVFLGRPRDPSPTTRWAVGYVLDRYLGVRWLWPGETGRTSRRAATSSSPPRHVISGEVAYSAEQRRHAPTVEGRVDTKSGDPLVEE